MHDYNPRNHWRRNEMVVVVVVVVLNLLEGFSAEDKTQ